MRELAVGEMKEILNRLLFGHLGCIDDEHPYVVPVGFAYEDDALYIFSFEGKKLECLRKNPAACFQLEEVMDSKSWRSVMLNCEYEELHNDTRDRGLSIILDRLFNENVRGKPLYLPFLDSREKMEKAYADQGIIFRLNIREWHGRLEEYEDW